MSRITRQKKRPRALVYSATEDDDKTPMPQRRTRQASTPRPVSPAGRHAAAPKHAPTHSRAKAGKPAKTSRPSQKTSTSDLGKVTVGIGSPSASGGLASPTFRKAVDEGTRVNIPGKGEVLLTRRHFLYGAAGVAAVAALGTAAYVADQIAGEDAGIATLNVPEEAVFNTQDCTMLENANAHMQLYASISLPYGSLVWANDDTYAFALMPTDFGKPLAQMAILSLTSGTCTTLLTNAIGEAQGFEIYDVRGCKNGVVWTEADILDGIWRVYSATHDGASLGEAILLEEGDTNWEMPMLAAVGTYAWWQTLPRTDGEAKYEPSKLKRSPFGIAKPEEVISSNGRMATPPYATSDGVVVTPRAQTSGTYYQLTHINTKGEITDSVILPSLIRPLEAGYGPTGFTFMYDAIYNYGGGIANLGTYAPATAGAASGDDPTGHAGAESYDSRTWFRYDRTPVAPPAWCGNWFMVKAPTAVAGVNLKTREYFTLEVKSGCDTYGEFLASTGTQSRIVTYCNIDHTSLEGETEHRCLVRVWEPVG